MGLAYSPESEWLRKRPAKEHTDSNGGNPPVIVKVEGREPLSTGQLISVNPLTALVRAQEVHLVATVVANALNGATNDILGRFASTHGEDSRGIVLQALQSDRELATDLLKTEARHPDFLEGLPTWPALRERLKVAIASLPIGHTQD